MEKTEKNETKMGRSEEDKRLINEAVEEVMMEQAKKLKRKKKRRKAVAGDREEAPDQK